MTSCTEPPAEDKNVPIIPLEREWHFWSKGAAGMLARAKITTRQGSRSAKSGRGAPPVATGAEDAPMIRIGSFNDVSGMWNLFNNLPPPSRTPIDRDIYQFQRNVNPTWEDPNNKNGGRWMYSIASVKDADAAWQNLYLAVVGETLDPNFEVLGIVLARRRTYTRFSVWTRDRNKVEIIMEIGSRIKAGIAPNIALEYQDHGAPFGQYRYVM